MKYEVYMNILSRENVDAVNSMGREEALKKIPKYKAYLDAMCFGFKGFKMSHMIHYTHVANVEAKDLDEVFHIMNVAKNGDSVEPMIEAYRSMSVGDIIFDIEAGKWWFVDNFGFAEINMDN